MKAYNKAKINAYWSRLMEKKELKHLTVRIDPELLKKFRYVADFHGRSANKEVLELIKKDIQNHEEKFGMIDIENK